MPAPQRSSLLVATVLAVLAAMLGIYCLGYFVRSKTGIAFESIWVRSFPTDTERLLFAPLARLESGLLRHIVVVTHPDGSHFATYQNFQSIPDLFAVPPHSPSDPTNLQP